MPRRSNNTAELTVVFRNAKIDLARLSNYNLHLSREEVDRIRIYIKLPEFQAWASEYSKNNRITVELLSQCQGIMTGDVFDYLGWPRDILALRLPSFDNETTLEDIVLPKLLVKVARVVNKTRGTPMDDNIQESEVSSLHWLLGKHRVSMLLLVVGIAMFITWLNDSHPWILEGVANTTSQLLTRIVNGHAQDARSLERQPTGAPLPTSFVRPSDSVATILIASPSTSENAPTSILFLPTL